MKIQIFEKSAKIFLVRYFFFIFKKSTKWYFGFLALKLKYLKKKRKYLGWKLKWKFVVISGLAIVITSQPHHIRSGQEYVNVRITSLDYILQKVFEDQHGFISNAKSKRWTFIMWRPSFPCDFFTRLNTTFGLICGLRSGFLWTLFPQMQDSNR